MTTPTAPHAEIRSFGYLHSPPPPATITVDLRECLRDPHVDPALRELTGHETPVRYAVFNTRGATGLIAHLTMLVSGLLEVSIPVSLSVGCGGGKHRAVVVAEEVAARLRLAGWPVQLHHRDVHLPVVHRGRTTDVPGEVRS
ncbi:RapZ C-terminal domain-containing protein [Amycolatopsis thermoflava]|uniref:RapZ C-terminal domain-containing protein n=1 Tax=Amycolatopsis thermoflava TaxID=84480 RepID=UPI003D761162